jgi:RNA-binding protein Nova
MEMFLFKILCPQSITGLIIGRKGAIINQLNQSTGAKIRLSQNNEFYPGTTDRILLGE